MHMNMWSVILYLFPLDLMLSIFFFFFFSGAYSHLQGLEKIILFPFRCDGQVSQGIKIHVPNVLALWVRCYNLFQLHCASRKQISPFTDSLEG